MRVADFRGGMISRSEGITAEKESEQLTKMLELELAHKRATWKQTGEKARSIRAAGFVFLFFVIVACLAGAYFAFMRVNEQRANPHPTSAIDH